MLCHLSRRTYVSTSKYHAHKIKRVLLIPSFTILSYNRFKSIIHRVIWHFLLIRLVELRNLRRCPWLFPHVCIVVLEVMPHIPCLISLFVQIAGKHFRGFTRAQCTPVVFCLFSGHREAACRTPQKRSCLAPSQIPRTCKRHICFVLEFVEHAVSAHDGDMPVREKFLHSFIVFLKIILFISLIYLRDCRVDVGHVLVAILHKTCAVLRGTLQIST